MLEWVTSPGKRRSDGAPAGSRPSKRLAQERVDSVDLGDLGGSDAGARGGAGASGRRAAAGAPASGALVLGPAPWADVPPPRSGAPPAAAAHDRLRDPMATFRAAAPRARAAPPAAPPAAEGAARLARAVEEERLAVEARRRAAPPPARRAAAPVFDLTGEDPAAAAPPPPRAGGAAVDALYARARAALPPPPPRPDFNDVAAVSLSDPFREDAPPAPEHARLEAEAKLRDSARAKARADGKLADFRRVASAAVAPPAPAAAEKVRAMQAELQDLERSLEAMAVKRKAAPARPGAAPALPAAARAAYAEATAQPDSFEVVVRHAQSNIEVRRHDLASLAPGTWVNDEIMNVVAALLLERDVRRRGARAGGPECHLFSSFFATRLYKDGDGYEYERVRRWTAPKKLARGGQPSGCLLDLDRIIVPVHQGLHWVTAVIDLENRRFQFLDSLGARDEACLAALARWLRDEFMDKRKEAREDVLAWPREFPAVPRQLNGCDCGIFALLFADHAARGAPMRFTQADMLDFRVKLCADILRLRID